jgi:plastocyanin
MAAVYKAYEAALDRHIALKVLPTEFLHDGTFAERFRREARVVARLEHPNIVPIYAYGIDQGTPWMAMRLVSGGALSGLLAQGRLASHHGLGILKGVAAALDDAHGRGVLHRDVKPQNILLDATGHVYLADFGIARMVEGSSVLTRTGLITGTPQYMAPEQAQGTGQLDRRCDIYALGIVAYEMLVGRVPFTADTPVAVLMKHILEPIPLPPPSEIREPVARALLKCLAKKPEDRWPTATSFVQALERGMGLAAPHGAADLGTPTRTVSALRRTERATLGVVPFGATSWTRTSRAFLVVSTVVGTGMAGWGYLRFVRPVQVQPNAPAPSTTMATEPLKATPTPEPAPIQLEPATNGRGNREPPSDADRRFDVATRLASVPSLNQGPNTPPPPTGVGSVWGRILYEGTVPPAEKVKLSADPACVEMNQDGLEKQPILVKDGGLANVFVYVKHGLTGTYPTPKEPAVIEQRGCSYRPHIVTLQIGQALKIRNSDDTLHNIHPRPTLNAEFNIGQPRKGMEATKTFDKAEVMFPVGCDVHPWMRAYISVLDHPFFTVSKEDGTFEIRGLPAGEYEIEAYHEKFKTLLKRVTVKPGISVQTAFFFKG